MWVQNAHNAHNAAVVINEILGNFSQLCTWFECGTVSGQNDYCAGWWLPLLHDNIQIVYWEFHRERKFQHRRCCKVRTPHFMCLRGEHCCWAKDVPGRQACDISPKKGDFEYSCTSNSVFSPWTSWNEKKSSIWLPHALTDNSRWHVFHGALRCSINGTSHDVKSTITGVLLWHAH